MPINLKFWLYLVLSCLFLNSCSTPQKQITSGLQYQIDMFIGEVLYTKGDNHWLKVEQGMPLLEGYSIKTGHDSSCDILMPNIGLFKIINDSVIELTTLTKGEEKITVEKGKTAFNIARKLKENEKFSVETTTAIAAVRGTEFIIETDGSRSKTLVTKGRIGLRKNLKLKVPANLSSEEVDKLLEIPVDKMQALETDSENNKKLEEKLNTQLQEGKSISQIQDLVSADKKETLQKIVPVSPNDPSLQFLKDINDPKRLKNLGLETGDTSQKTKKENQMDKEFDQLKKKIDRTAQDPSNN